MNCFYIEAMCSICERWHILETAHLLFAVKIKGKKWIKVIHHQTEMETNGSEISNSSENIIMNKGSLFSTKKFNSVHDTTKIILASVDTQDMIVNKIFRTLFSYAYLYSVSCEKKCHRNYTSLSSTVTDLCKHICVRT